MALARIVDGMPMSLRETLEPFLADKRATWNDDTATWEEGGGTRMLLALDGPLLAQAVVDAHVRALAGGAALTLAHEGSATDVARRTAARFGIELLDVATLAPGDDPMPWGPIAVDHEPVPTEVEPYELLAMPWHAADDDQHEMLPAGRDPREAHPHGTLAQEWGLPWPRPVPPMDAVSRADPSVWHAQERLDAVREDLTAHGAPSFGAVRPDGSAWLRRLDQR